MVYLGGESLHRIVKEEGAEAIFNKKNLDSSTKTVLDAFARRILKLEKEIKTLKGEE